MLDNSITKPGVLLFKDGNIYVDGWELKTPGMCREHAIFACLHVAQELMKAAAADIASPGGAQNCIGDMPLDTPIDWLSDETQRFLRMARGLGEGKPDEPFPLLP
jgi:hypothetical protein